MGKTYFITVVFFFSRLIAIAAIDSIPSKTFTFKKLPDTTLELTVFYPAKSSDKKPVMILFHGGSWRVGSREIMFPFCKYFANRGIVAVSASYRHIKDGTDIIKGKEMCIKDAKSAIRWVKEHAKELNVDPNKIILGGASAGGHIATMAALDTSINEDSDKIAISTKAQVFTLFNPAYSLSEDALVQPFRFPATNLPPLIMFFGSNDNYRSAAQKIYEKAINSNKKAEMWYALGQRHAFFTREDAWLRSMCFKTDEFLVSIGFLKPPVAPMIYSEGFNFSSTEK